VLEGHGPARRHEVLVDEAGDLVRRQSDDRQAREAFGVEVKKIIDQEAPVGEPQTEDSP
jgi:hypothetical protein